MNTDDEAIKKANDILKNFENNDKSNFDLGITDGFYFPGTIEITDSLTKRYNFKSIRNPEARNENIYYFNGQIYERAEEFIKTEAHYEHLKQWREMGERTSGDSKYSTLNAKLNRQIHAGPSSFQINEVEEMIRRTTFTDEEMNPSGFIPFKNGLLSLKTRKLEPFSRDYFYTYQVNANYLEKHITLKDVPMFSNLLNTVFYPKDIPMVLSYLGYSFYPTFPAQKTLFILGRERIGKGTTIRVIEEGLMPKGSGAVSLARLLTGERFQFTGIEGKNLLVDDESRRRFRHDAVLDWSAFCNLFGGDRLSLEPKGKEAHDYTSKAKGIFLGNLPFIPVYDPPTIARILLVETKNERPKTEIDDYDKKIIEKEGDAIATLLMQVLFKLIDRNFKFPGQMSDDETAAKFELLSDPVRFFIEDRTERNEGSTVRSDEAYSLFEKWLKIKGITHIASHTFMQRFGKEYPRKRAGTRKNRYYIFTNCMIIDDDSDDVKQLGHGDNSQETLKYGDSGDKKDGVQVKSDTQRVRNLKNIEKINIKDVGVNLDTEKNLSGNRDFQASGENNPVSKLNHNLQNEPKRDDDLSDEISKIKNRIIEVIKHGDPSNELSNIQWLIKVDFGLDAEETENIVRAMVDEKMLSFDEYKRRLKVVKRK